jgi:hypothetical protein
MTEGATPSSAEEHLAAIASLSSALDQHGVEYWLFGGWAVDFWVGAVSRQHDDIDVAAWRQDYDTIRAALVAAGWRHTPAADEVVGTRYQWRSAQVEFTFVIADDDGSILVPLAGQPMVWSTEPFGNGRRELLGVGGRTIPLALLRTGKSFPREGAAEAAKDRADYDALSRLQDEPPS